MTVAIAATCTACGACLATCPERALVPAPRRPAVLDSLCTDCLACLEVCPVDAIIPIEGTVHPIEEASYRILAERVDLSAWPAGARDVVARMVHATADESFAATARIGEQAVEAAVAALAAGAAVVCDARMVVAGIPAVAGAVCFLDQVPEATPGDTREPYLPPEAQTREPYLPPEAQTRELYLPPEAQTRELYLPPEAQTRELYLPPEAQTRSAAAIRLAAERHPDGALWVVGNAPTALFALLDLCARGAVRPAAVVGLPVGYVGAAESKAALWAGELRPLAITNSGNRGGSPAAAGAVNALARLGRSGGPGRRP